MQLLDMRTIMIGYFISNLLITVVMYRIWAQNRKRFRGTTHWLVNFVLQTVGQVLIIARGSIPDFVSIVVANVLILAGVLAFLLGLGRFMEVRVRMIPNYALLAVFAALYWWFGIIAPSLPSRLAVLSLCMMVLVGQCMWMLVRRAPEGTEEVYQGTAVILTLFFILYGFRALNAMINPSREFFMETDTVDSVFAIASQMLVIALTFALILMINARLFYELGRTSAEREALVGELRKLANTDRLTGIFNRLKLEDKLTAEVLRARRYARPLSVILIDADHFKDVNDSLGHLVGDGVLRDLASILAAHIRESDIVGRWGGEEFLIINPETAIEGAIALAEKLRKIIEEHEFFQAGRRTVSMGVASLQGDEWEESMLKRADDALYRAKGMGRNRVAR